MLALWEYFWDLKDWIAEIPAPPPHGHGHKNLDGDQYRAYDDDYWTARDTRLSAAPRAPKYDGMPDPDLVAGTVAERSTRLLTELRQASHEHNQILTLQTEYANQLAALRAAPDLATMRQLTSYIAELKATLDTLGRRYKRRINYSARLRDSLHGPNRS